MRAWFDGISHNWLLAHIPLAQALRQQWLKAGGIEKHRLAPTEAGVPQDGGKHPALRHLTLKGWEQTLRAACPKRVRGQRTKVHLRRFSAEFLLTGPSPAVLQPAGQPLVERVLAERGLDLSQAKTRLIHSAAGVECLGQPRRTYRGLLFCTPAKMQVHAFRQTVRGIVPTPKQPTAGDLIVQLNPVIRGWAP